MYCLFLTDGMHTGDHIFHIDAESYRERCCAHKGYAEDISEDFPL